MHFWSHLNFIDMTGNPSICVGMVKQLIKPLGSIRARAPMHAERSEEWKNACKRENAYDTLLAILTVFDGLSKFEYFIFVRFCSPSLISCWSKNSVQNTTLYLIQVRKRFRKKMDRSFLVILSPDKSLHWDCTVNLKCLVSSLWTLYLLWFFFLGRNIAPCKGIRDTLGFWIPPRGFRIPITGCQIFFSGTWIPDSNC